MRKVPEHILIGENATVRDALAAIDRGAIQLALVVDTNRKLMATVTDGDIRRGLLRGVTLDQPACEVMRLNPVTVSVGAGQAATLQLMRERKLRHVPLVEAEGRIAGLELIEEAFAQPANDTWVVLMAGGLGVRLRPLTDKVPKPMLPVGGRPLLESIIRNLAQQGFKKFYVSVNYKRDVIQDHFGDGSAFGVDIDYLIENERLGTAGALSLLPRRPDNPLLVMNGDLMTPLHFAHLLQHHQEHGADATLSVREHITDIPFGVVKSSGAKLMGIDEKPRQTVKVNAGIYLLGPRALAYIPSDRPCDMPEVFRSLINDGGNASVFTIQEYWLDIGRHDDLERANAEIEKIFYS